MRKLVKGLLVPAILLVALATFGLAMAAGNSRTDRNRGGSDSGTTASAVEDGSDAGRTADARPTRRGRQAPRNSQAGTGIDEKSWWWWHNKNNNDNDEGNDENNDDEDDDEDQSPSNP